MPFVGSTAIVTGGASGIGLAISERLARDGAKVSIFDVDLEAGERAVQGIRAQGGEALACAVDVSDRAQVDEAVAATREHLGPVLVLVNGAGKDGFDPFMDISPEQWERIIAVNLMGTFHCCQAALAVMQPREDGVIVNFGSDAGRVGSSREAVYSATKGGVIAFTKTLAREVARYGIRVNCVSPGPTDTALLAQVAEASPNLREALARSIPMRRIGEPTDLAPAVVFLAGDGARYITGQTLSVSGGLTMA